MKVRDEPTHIVRTVQICNSMPSDYVPGEGLEGKGVQHNEAHSPCTVRTVCAQSAGEGRQIRAPPEPNQLSFDFRWAAKHRRAILAQESGHKYNSQKVGGTSVW